MVAEALPSIAAANPSPRVSGAPAAPAAAQQQTTPHAEDPGKPPAPLAVPASARTSDADTYTDADAGTLLGSPQLGQVGKKPRASGVSRVSSVRKPVPDDSWRQSALSTQGEEPPQSIGSPGADTGTDTSAVHGARRGAQLDVETHGAGSGDDGQRHRHRRRVPRRPVEYTLRGQHLSWGAPFPDSGCIAPTRPSWWQMWRVPGPLSLRTRQGWYLLVFHAIGAVMISAAANFGIACAMYRKHSDTDITFWVLKHNTIAGDMAVTILIQGTVTFAITSAMVHRDIAMGLIAPLRRPWPYLLHLPSTPSAHGCNGLGTRLPSQVPPGKELPMGPLVTPATGGFNRFCLWFIRFLFCGTERNDILAPSLDVGQRCLRLIWTLVQGLGLSALVFWAPYWGISLAITAPIWTHRQMAHTWVGPAIKCTYGGILALVINPFFCIMAMGAEPNVKRAYPELQLWRDDSLAEINALTLDANHQVLETEPKETAGSD